MMLTSFAMTDAMKVFLGKFGMPILILIAIGAAVLLIDKRGYDRAKEQDAAAAAERSAIVAAIVGKVDQDLDKRLADISTSVGGKITTIEKERTVVEPIIRQELARDPRLAAPDSCLSPGLLAAINQARGYPAGAELGKAGSSNPPGLPAGAASH